MCLINYVAGYKSLTLQDTTVDFVCLSVVVFKEADDHQDTFFSQQTNMQVKQCKSKGLFFSFC